jgi:hypothetical protein
MHTNSSSVSSTQLMSLEMQNSSTCGAQQVHGGWAGGKVRECVWVCVWGAGAGGGGGEGFQQVLEGGE